MKPALCPPLISTNALGSADSSNSLRPWEYGMTSSSRLCAMKTGALIRLRFSALS
ncbi:hypothetical protein D3C83_112420 [compost metagenome]